MNTQQTTSNQTLTQTALIALIRQLDPKIEDAQLDTLVAETMSSFAPVKREIKAVAKASEVLANAQAHGQNLLSAAIRPSRGKAVNRWVINFTFSNWNTALTFARFWGEKIGLSFNVQRIGRDQFGVSIPLISAPANAVTVAARFDREGAAEAFAKALKGLSV